MSVFDMFKNNTSALSKFLDQRHPLTEEITDAVNSRALDHSLKPTHLLMLLANTLESQYMPGVEQANILARMAVVLHDNPELHNELVIKMEALR